MSACFKMLMRVAKQISQNTRNCSLQSFQKEPWNLNNSRGNKKKNSRRKYNYQSPLTQEFALLFWAIFLKNWKAKSKILVSWGHCHQQTDRAPQIFKVKNTEDFETIILFQNSSMWYYTVQYQHACAKSYNSTNLNMIHKNSALLKFLLLETFVLCRRNHKCVLLKQKNKYCTSRKLFQC